MPRMVTFRSETRDDVGNVLVQQATGVINEAPVGQGMSVTPAEVAPGGFFDVRILATDPEGRPLIYSLTSSEGVISQPDPTAQPNLFRVQV